MHHSPFMRGSYALKCLIYLRAVIATPTILPARESVPFDSAVETPLFDFETVQLTDAALERIKVSHETAKISKRLAFAPIIESQLLPQNSSRKCKVFPGDQEWPSDSEWSTFNDVLGGALISTIPLASPCYTNWGNYDSEKCAAITAGWSISSAKFISDPTASSQPLVEGRTCLLTNIPFDNCTLGGLPSYVVNASSVAQIQLAVNYARNTNIRLVVKNTGHNGLGRSIGAGALSIWTHHLKDIRFIPDFKIDGYSGTAFKLGAGVQLFEVYEAAEKFGVTALGGVCTTIGYAGGYLAGGGHGPFGSIYGLAADQILAFEVVTTDGRFRTVSPSHHPELFWGLAGGGGSTFAVVTSVIIRVYPRIGGTISQIKFSNSNITNETFYAGIQSYWDNFIRFTDAKTWSHYWLFNISGVASFEIRPFYAPHYTIPQFNVLLQPWFDSLKALGIPATINTTYHESFLSGFEEFLYNSGSIIGLAGSRLFPRQNWEDDVKRKETFDAMMYSIRNGKQTNGYTMSPRLTTNISNAVNPAWRTAIAFLAAGVTVPGTASPEQAAAQGRVLTDDIMGGWRRVAPNEKGGGAYANEGDLNEPNWQEAFHGDTYAELRRVKKKWDPEGLFYAYRTVGSEEWEIRDGERGVQTQDGRLCRI